jgi:hypothetical protein
MPAIGTQECGIGGRFGFGIVGLVEQNSVVRRFGQLSCQQKILRGRVVLDLGVERLQVLW